MALNDPYDCRVADARERAMSNAAPHLCYEHGRKVGRIVDAALLSVIEEFGRVTATDARSLAEAVTEAFWTEMEALLPNDMIDGETVQRGLQDESRLYRKATS